MDLHLHFFCCQSQSLQLQRVRLTEAAGAGPRGLFAGWLPTILEDVPDMAFKFAAYETMRAVHSNLRGGKHASVQVCCRCAPIPAVCNWACLHRIIRTAFALHFLPASYAI